MKYTVMPCDFDYTTNKQIIEDLIKDYPFLNVQLIGRTAVGRGIFALSLGNNKKSVVYVGSVRGSDGLSGLILLLFIERLCRAVKNNAALSSVNIRKALSYSGITVIPCLNPDGREIFLKGPIGAEGMRSFVSSFYNKNEPVWEANAMGVDISRNFIFRNEAPDAEYCAAPSFFGGDYPESEAETRAFTRFCRLKKFRQCIEICDGEDEIFYTSDEKEPEVSRMMAKIIACASGITVCTERKSSHPGIADWFIKEFRCPAFSLGINGKERELYSVYGKAEEALTLFSLL